MTIKPAWCFMGLAASRAHRSAELLQGAAELSQGIAAVLYMRQRTAALPSQSLSSATAAFCGPLPKGQRGCSRAR